MNKLLKDIQEALNIKPKFQSIFFISFIITLLTIIPAQALSPLWVSDLTGIDQDIQDTGGQHFLLFMAISDDGKTIAATTFDGSIYLMDKTGKLFRNKTAGNESSEILSLSLSSDGNYLALSSVGSGPASNLPKKISLLNRNLEELWNYSTPTFVYNSAVSSDGSYSVFGSHENITCIGQDGSIFWNYPTASQVISLDISNDCEYIVAVTDNWEALCLNRSGSVLWKNEFREPSDIKISDNGNYVCLTTSLRKAFFMDNKGNVLWNKTLPPGTKYAKCGISGNGDEVMIRSTGAVSYDQSTGFVLAYDQSGWLRWNYSTESGYSLRDTISAPRFILSKDGRYSVTADGDSMLLLDEEGNETGTFSFNEKIRSIAISADGARIAAITSDELYYFDNTDAVSKDTSMLTPDTIGENDDETSPATQAKQSPLPLFMITPATFLAVFFRRTLTK